MITLQAIHFLYNISSLFISQTNDDYDPAITALARVERTDFLQPMFIGEVAQLSADMLYTSEHSVEVAVTVVAENIITGTYASYEYVCILLGYTGM